MSKKIAFCIAAFAVWIAAYPASAQQAEKMHRIGFLSTASVGDFKLRLAAFRQGLRELGYIEGRNIDIAWRYGRRNRDRLAEMAAELARLKIDVIVTTGQPAPDAARNATRTIPIVVCVTGDYVAQGLAESLRRPGGNVTGMSAIAPDLVGKQLELFKEIVPGLSRVAILRNPEHRGHTVTARLAKKAAKALGLNPVVIGVDGDGGIVDAFGRMAAEGVDGALVLRGGLFVRNRARVAALARKAGLPTMVGHREEAVAGGLMAYGTNVVALYHRAATFVDKILRGADPAEMPIEQPTKFHLVVNLKTAKALGITVPPAILLRATEVIE